MVKRRRMAASKARRRRSRSPQSGEDVESARDRFKGALLDLLPRSEEESESTDDERQWSSIKSRRSGVGKKSNDKSNQEPSGFRQAFKMKLYDRTVDMSNYTDSTPLYPICRAWIANQSHNFSNPIKKYEPNVDTKNTEYKDNAEIDIRRNIYKLPPPSYYLQNGEKLRVPKTIQRHTTYPNILPKEGECPSKEELLKDNLAHWTKVRESWMKASQQNEKRYSKSINILSSVFYNSQKTF